MSLRQVILLEKRRNALLEQLRTLPNLMRGKVYERQRRCGRKGCACYTAAGPRHPGLQLTVNHGGRTRTRFVRKAERDEVEAMVLAYQRLWRVVEELTEVNLALLQERHGLPKTEEP